VEHAQLESDHFVEHYDFDDEMREHYTKQAEILDDEIRKERSESKKARLVKTADTYYEAISEVEGLDKGEAVDWIQNHAGGKKSSEMADAVEGLSGPDKRLVIGYRPGKIFLVQYLT